jgi:hypothetical protein
VREGGREGVRERGMDEMVRYVLWSEERLDIRYNEVQDAV